MRGWAAKNRKTVLATNRAAQERFRAAHPGYGASKSAEWVRRNPEKRAAILAKSTRKNRVRILERSREWYAGHPEARNAAHRVYNNDTTRRNRLGTVGRHTNAEFQTVLKRQGGKCNICDLKTKLERDHIVALSNGGTDFIANIQGLCRSCNAKKWRKEHKP